MIEDAAGNSGSLSRPVFVVGSNKSGTSLLYLLLSLHPELSPIRSFRDRPLGPKRRATLHLHDYGFGEGQKIPDILPKLRPGEGVNQFAAPPYVARHRLTEADVEPDDRPRLEAAYRNAMTEPLRRLCEKSPPNLIRTRYLQAVFPDACFVAITRRPYTNIAATAKRHTKWGTLHDMATHWARGYSLFLDDRPHLRRCLVISYESLVTDVWSTMREIFSHCEIDPAALARLDIPLIHRDLDAQLELLLTPDDRMTITRLCGGTLERLGYRSDPEPAQGWICAG